MQPFGSAQTSRSSANNQDIDRSTERVSRESESSIVSSHEHVRRAHFVLEMVVGRREIERSLNEIQHWQVGFELIYELRSTVTGGCTSCTIEDKVEFLL